AGGSTSYTVRVTDRRRGGEGKGVEMDAGASGLKKTGVVCSGSPGQCTVATTPTVAQLESGCGFALPALASGQFYELTVSADVTATSGSVSNTATVAAPAGTTDPTAGNNSATDTDTVTPVADLAVTKTDGVSSVNAGGLASYTVRV